MTENQKYLKDLSEIRSIMERSSSFISLSGLTGVFAGIIAIIGSAFAYYLVFYKFSEVSNLGYIDNINPVSELKIILIIDAIVVLTLSLLSGLIFSWRNAKKKGLKIWDNTAKRLLINLFIPLISGGVFCFTLLRNGDFYAIAGTTMIFYGLALINASKYTLNDIRYLGIIEIFIGFFALWFPEYGLFAWAFGFGILHIIYGTFMYMKYERKF